MLSRRTKCLLLVSTLAAFMIGIAAWQHRRYKHLAVHEPGMIHRSAWLDADVLSSLIEEHQYRSVVNLCGPDEMGRQRWVDEEHAVTKAGAKFLVAPMPFSASPAETEIAKHLEIMNNPDNYPMLVHCQHGVTRTAKFLAIYDIVHRKRTADESLSDMPLFGRDDHSVNVRAFVRSFERQYRNLYPQARAGALDILAN